MTRLNALPQVKDLAVALLLFVVVLLMILPIPTPVVDGLIGLNFGIAILLLMTGVYLSNPLALSSLPGIILISTIFRLALSITTTRLILGEGDAGEIVQTFGSMVVSGNVVVGMVVFFIITIVQFIVIAKGSERIAEVGARFTLDALPGKQMAIDAELRNGDIDNVEAGDKRKLLERESQFYGAMDGAMKFVKGDAIAGLIIIFVNLIGGLTIGMLQLGMPLGAAVQKYSLLTVGDALISQIPALFMSITAAIIVTRVDGETQRNLGSDIIGQVVGDVRAVRLAAIALIGMGLLPGFPTAILCGLGLIFLTLSFVALLRPPPASTEEDDADMPETEAQIALPAIGDTPVAIVMSPTLYDSYGLADLWQRLLDVSVDAAAATGAPPVRVTAVADDSLAETDFRLMVNGAAVLWSRADPGRLSLDDVHQTLTLHDIPFKIVKTALWRRRLTVDVDQSDRLADLGLTARDHLTTLFDEVREALIQNAAALLGIQETRALLDGMEATHPMLVGEVLRSMTLQKISDVFKRLLEERIPLSHAQLILEALVEWSPTEQTPFGLTEYCRIALKQQICAASADADRTIAAIVIERETEDVLRGALRDTAIGTYLVLGETQTADLLSEARRQVDRLSPKGTVPVLLTSMDVRRHLRVFLKRNSIDLRVLSFQELSDDYTVIPCSTLRLTARAKAARKAQRPETEMPPHQTPTPEEPPT
ncbi:MAG: type III secretion system export apparatus subunit SctV [Pseudomonadota bacterium]